MKKFLTIVSLFLLSLQIQAGESLNIVNVRNFASSPGSIDTATIFITPKGMYAECHVFLDFSVRCTQFSSNYDSLEVQLKFSLPERAEVTDLWLWVGNIPVQAGIYDRWTASQIYEGIVNRRQDPALLMKESETDYKLNIFPMVNNLPRKVKMTFLIPLNSVTADRSVLSLPVNILKLSNCTIQKVMLGYKPNANLLNPKLDELPLQNFTLQTDPQFGQYYALNITNNLAQLNTLSLSLEQAIPRNFFAGAYSIPQTNQSVYQLELNLKQILGINTGKKTVFMVDFLKSNSTLSRKRILESLKAYIKSSFNDGDSLNIIFSGLITNFGSNNWVSADSTSLAQFLNTLDTNRISNNSNVSALLMDGINFIRTKGNEGNLVLISSSKAYTNNSSANALLGDIISYMGTPKIPVHTIYVDDMSYLTYLSNNTYYRGNEYLYMNLSTLTGGEFQTILSYITDQWGWNYQTISASYESRLDFVMPRLSGYFTALNVYPSLQTGFTFADYKLNQANGFNYLDLPYRQVGKLVGGFPMNVSVAAQTPDGQLYNAQLTIDSTQILINDSITKTIWAGQNLRNMLSFTQTNSVVFQIVVNSMAERVLCKYTAFLALEPGMTPPDTVIISIENSGGTPIIGLHEQELQQGENNFSVYPNPVSKFGAFEFMLEDAANVRIDIYNIQGQLVKNVADERRNSGMQKITFDTNGLETGIYFYRVMINDRLFTGKIVVMK